MPIDAKHRVLAVISLCAVFSGKVVSLMPPLAIKWAVDIITDNAAAPAEKANAPFVAIAAFFFARLASTFLIFVRAFNPFPPLPSRTRLPPPSRLV